MKGTVGGSFVSSAVNAGLTSVEASAVIKAMQWQMDFRKLKKGDEFSVLMSREMLDGKREQSQLLGVRLRSDGERLLRDSRRTVSSTTATVRGWRRASCASQPRASSACHPTLTRVV
ncbi:hypothetical protein ACLK2H_10705 [Escherichia coli]